MLKDVRAILFDAVGTLIYPDPPVVQVYFDVGCSFGSQLSKPEIALRFGAAFKARESQYLETNQSLERKRWREIVCEVFYDVTDADGALFDSLWHHFAQSENWSVYDDVIAAWCRMANSGLIIGVASNFDDRLLDISQDLEPLDNCEHLFWSARLGHSKPSHQFFQAIERRLELSPEEILLVGDHPLNDHQGAQQAGWHSTLIDRSNCFKNNSRIRSLSELV